MNPGVSEFKCAVEAGNIFLQSIGSKNHVADKDFSSSGKWLDINELKKILDAKVADTGKKLFIYNGKVEVPPSGQLPKLAKDLLRSYAKHAGDLDEVKQFILLKNAHYYVYVSADKSKWVFYEEVAKHTDVKVQGVASTILNACVKESIEMEIGFIIPIESEKE